jgi:Protein of unknown function (DUF3662)/FHA domain
VGRADRFERRLEGLVGDTFARVFGGNVVTEEVSQALEREAAVSVRPLAGGRLLAPNRYEVLLSPTDHRRLAGDAQGVTQSLTERVLRLVADQGWDTYGDVVVSLKRSEALHTGQFRTSSSVDPDVARATPGQRNAKEAPMSQPPGHPEENGQYGYDRGPRGYGQQTYAEPSQDPRAQESGGYDPRDGRYAQQGYGEQGYGQQGYYDQQGGYDQAYYDQGYQGSGATLTIDDGSGRSYELHGGTTVVGRGQESDFRLPDTGVSRRHLEINWDGHTATLSDLGSTNGTTVNGNPVQTWQLSDGDVIRIGHSTLVYRAAG